MVERKSGEGYGKCGAVAARVAGRFFLRFSRKSAVTTPSENEICHCKRIIRNTFPQMIEISISRNLQGSLGVPY